LVLFAFLKISGLRNKVMSLRQGGGAGGFFPLPAGFF